jgi:drug/metabolite transporter (DMT)-like permease
VSLPLILPLIAGIGYAMSALVIKRASEFGVGVWRTAFVANIVGALIFQPLWLLGGNLPPELWWRDGKKGQTLMSVIDALGCARKGEAWLAS